MNDNPIQEQQSLMDRARSRGVDSYKWAGLKVMILGMAIMFVGEIADWNELSTLGIWVMLAAFPVHGLYLIARYAQAIKKANQEADEAVEAAKKAREARGAE